MLTRPRELTRVQLRDLQLALDQAGYTERNLEVAWREMTNQDIAARIVGFIRQAALGDPLLSYDERVDRALGKIVGSRSLEHSSASVADQDRGADQGEPAR